jgi:hypothetical protein
MRKRATLTQRVIAGGMIGIGALTAGCGNDAESAPGRSAESSSSVGPSTTEAMAPAPPASAANAAPEAKIAAPSTVYQLTHNPDLFARLGKAAEATWTHDSEIARKIASGERGPYDLLAAQKQGEETVQVWTRNDPNAFASAARRRGNTVVMASVSGFNAAGYDCDNVIVDTLAQTPDLPIRVTVNGSAPQLQRSIPEAQRLIDMAFACLNGAQNLPATS